MSLLEVMVAAFVLALTLPAVAALQLQSIRASTEAQQRDFAWAAANAKAEEMQSLDWDLVVSGKDEISTDDGRTLERTWTVVNNTPAKGALTITVLVITDKRKGLQSEVKLTVVRSQLK